MRDARRRLRGAGKVIIGASGTSMDGWIASEEDSLDVTRARTFALLWPGPSVTHFLAEHVWEHLTPEEASIAVRNCAGVLLPGGRLRIAVPDGRHPSAAYIEHVRPGGTGPGADDHKVLYTVESLSRLIEESGLTAVPLEWWDADGRFHHEPWSPVDGMVSRSADHDERNRDSPLAYTSLIVDGIKPS